MFYHQCLYTHTKKKKLVCQSISDEDYESSEVVILKVIQVVVMMMMMMMMMMMIELVAMNVLMIAA